MISAQASNHIIRIYSLSLVSSGKYLDYTQCSKWKFRSAVYFLKAQQGYTFGKIK
jgi:hypothetical protein